MWLWSGASMLGDSLLLRIIAAVVMGVTSIAGSWSEMLHTLSVDTIIVTLARWLDLAGFVSYDQRMTLGVVIRIGGALGKIAGPLHICRAGECKA